MRWTKGHLKFDLASDFVADLLHRSRPSNPVKALHSTLLNIFTYLDEVDTTDPTAG